MKKKFEQFIKGSVEQICKDIHDMTYLYKNTDVPTTHYKKILNDTVEEILPGIIEMGVMDVYYKSLKHIKDENPQLFMKALLCLECGLKTSDLRVKDQVGLNDCMELYMKEKIIIDKRYKELIENPITQIDLEDDYAEKYMN